MVIHYMDFDLTDRCLRSLRRLDHKPLEVLVIDNSPDHPSGANLARAHPEVILLPMERNLGFAGGNNIGIRLALQRNADVVMLINNDTEIIEPSLLHEGIELLRSDTSIGLVGATVLVGPTSDEQQTELGHPFFSVRDWIKQRAWQETDGTAGLAGVCWIIPADVVRHVGLLDERFFMYLEDNDFCYRLRSAGYRFGRTAAGIRHYQRSRSNASLTTTRSQEYYKNRVYFLRKHGGTRTLAFLMMIRFAVTKIPPALLRPHPGTELAAGLRILRGMARNALTVDSARDAGLTSGTGEGGS